MLVSKFKVGNKVKFNLCHFVDGKIVKDNNTLIDGTINSIISDKEEIEIIKQHFIGTITYDDILYHVTELGDTSGFPFIVLERELIKKEV